MAYTVVSVFSADIDADQVKNNLTQNGIDEANIVISKSKLEDNTSAEDFREDEKTKGFWDHIFIHDNELLDAYRRKSVGNTNIVVYADNYIQAQKAKKILNDQGAIEVHKNQPEYTEEEQKNTSGLPEDVYNGIIAKARHNIYFLGSERTYSSPTKGMNDEMDSLGSKD